MKHLFLVMFWCALATATGSPVAAGGASRPAILANDNRMAAGHLAGRELHLSVDAVWGRWYPDGPKGDGVPIQAFAETGEPPQIPGPLIRVPSGTVVVLRVRNAVSGTTLTVHGLMDRPALRDRPFDVAFGRTREVRFRAGASGTYYYWGSTAGRTIHRRAGSDSQLNGAIVVDPPGAANRSNDRVFVIGQWDNVRTAQGDLDFAYEVNVINGRSWPYTERLSYSQGETVRWRWIDAAYGKHPLHLHGFFFSVDSRGDGTADTLYPASDRDLRVTELVEPGRTFSMTWKAARAGNWLFHCHLSYHAMGHAPFDDMLNGGPRMSDAQEAYLSRHAGMGGLILGFTVRAPQGQVVAQKPVSRRIGLAVESAPDNLPDAPSFRYVLDEGGKKIGQPGSVGPPMILTRGVTVAIDITNHLAEATAIHWHGIELQDSYYDGAAGFSGEGNHRAPMIAPGETFEAIVTPPRAGTFIYHTHMDDAYQLRAGLLGPLIVMEPGETFDSSTDHIFTIATAHASADELALLVNGVRQPPRLVVRAGVRQRLRFINMTTFWTNAMISLSSGGRTIQWKPRAVDGADLAPSRRTSQPAVDTITIGQTRDYTFTPAGGSLLLQIWPDPSMPAVAIPVKVIGAT
jgi:FtsP/CotA-like multicopper oxidase with cupredoxin domain